ncbi:MAG: adenosylcobinamide-phosphate synthase CbiB [Lachnospiraceae bacterium]|nr:adenosylcobinamide-phosphate synthase CbiB [Lachnospiraceae bacterium]
MRYHIIALVAGFLLDMILGDPYNFPHPIRLIGKLISFLERRLYIENDESGSGHGSIENDGSGSGHGSIENDESGSSHNLGRGMILVIAVVLTTAVSSGLILLVSYNINTYLGVIIESIMTYQILAAKCLRDESMKVYRELEKGDVEGARKAVSMIVGRDTTVLDDIGIAKAAIETVAENTSDGVIAPMIYTAIGGPVLGFVYKAINTMDSMVGYKNDRYLYFGRCAAKLDDIVNYLPSRISAMLMIISSLFLGKEYSAKDAAKIYNRDRYKHASPNSAQTESVCAGALGIRLAGDAVYFGKVHHKEYIGDKRREVEYKDIKRANRLMYATAVLCEIACVALCALFV